MSKPGPQILVENFANLSGSFTYNETAGEYRRDKLVAGREYILYLNEYKYTHPGWILTDKKKQKKRLNPVN